MSAEQITEAAKSSQEKEVEKRRRKKEKSKKASSNAILNNGEVHRRGRGFGTGTASELRSLPDGGNSVAVKLKSSGPEETALEAREKKAKNLRRKLQDIEALQKRIDSGELRQPEKNQLEKIGKRGQIETELIQLEAEMAAFRLQSDS